MSYMVTSITLTGGDAGSSAWATIPAARREAVRLLTTEPHILSAAILDLDHDRLPLYVVRRNNKHDVIFEAVM